uniref:Uncharacterized protein n=1 Tax=Steinernema glaseri TaxID=37863 RepID=A0A1I7ZWE2_9BILA
MASLKVSRGCFGSKEDDILKFQRIYKCIALHGRPQRRCYMITMSRKDEEEKRAKDSRYFVLVYSWWRRLGDVLLGLTLGHLSTLESKIDANRPKDLEGNSANIPVHVLRGQAFPGGASHAASRTAVSPGTRSPRNRSPNAILHKRIKTMREGRLVKGTFAEGEDGSGDRSEGRRPPSCGAKPDDLWRRIRVPEETTGDAFRADLQRAKQKQLAPRRPSNVSCQEADLETSEFHVCIMGPL